MSKDINHTSKILYNLFPISLYKRISNRNLIFPYYHTVTEQPGAHLKHLGFYRKKADFLNDLDFLNKNYRSSAINEIKQSGMSAAFHLTFDDGLSEIYSAIVPILLEQKISATFFINSDFIDNKELFYRHKISILINEVENKQKSEKLCQFLSLENNKEIIPSLLRLQYDDIETINNLAEQIDVSFEEYLSLHKPYLTTEQLIEIKNAGFYIGNHSKNHPKFEAITFDEQKAQVIETNIFLEEKLSINNEYFSFPFGLDKVGKDFFDFLYNDEKVKYSFGTAGLKKDEYKNHFHRINMEQQGFTAKEIVKFEYAAYLYKRFFNKHKIHRS